MKTKLAAELLLARRVEALVEDLLARQSRPALEHRSLHAWHTSARLHARHAPRAARAQTDRHDQNAEHPNYW